MGIASTKREVSAAGGMRSAGFFGLTVARLFGVDVRWSPTPLDSKDLRNWCLVGRL